MTIKEKIIACHGNVNAKSTARMCGVNYHRVYAIWSKNGLKINGSSRSLQAYKNRFKR